MSNETQYIMKNLILAFGVIAVSFSLLAQEKSDQVSVASANEETRDFLREAATGGFAEIKLGGLAHHQGTSPEIREYGKKMVMEHQKANDELKLFADRMEYREFPVSHDDKAEADFKRLEGLKGAEFDREYRLQMIEDHQKMLALFRRQAESGQNAELRSWAQQQLPTLEQHLQQIRELNTPN